MKNPGNFTFIFNFILHGDTVKELDKFKNQKASQKTDILIKIVKENVDFIYHFLYHNYRPLSILPNLSKVYERLM